MKRPMVWFGLAMLMGEILGLIFTGRSLVLQLWEIWSLAVVMTAGILIFCIVKGIWRKQRLTSLCLSLMPFFFALGIGGIMEQARLDIRLERLADSYPGALSGYVIEVQEKADYCVYVVRSEAVLDQSVDIRCIVEVEEDSAGQDALSGEEICIWDKVYVSGRISPLEHAANPGCFDGKNYYLQKNIHLQMDHAQVLSVLRPSPSWVHGLFGLRRRMLEVIQRSLDEAEAGIMAAMVTGDKALVPGELYDLYQNQGIGHILAISALHLSIVGMGFYKLLRRMYVPGPIRQVLALMMISLFILTCGFSISSIRAAVMFMFTMGSYLIGRRRDELTALATAGICLMWIWPYCICTYAFLMSFGCILSLIAMMKVRGKGSGIYITLFTLPLTAWFQYELSIYSVLINMFVVPAMGILYPMGLIGSLVGCAWLLPGKILLRGAGVLLYIFEVLCQTASGLPFAHVVTGRPAAWKLLIIYGCLGYYLWQRYKQRKDRKSRSTRIGTVLRNIWPVAYLLLLLPRIPDTPEVLYLDVGQGDCQLIRTATGKNYMIDGGSSTKNEVGEQVIAQVLKYYGIRRLDGLFLTHMDADHINGCQWLLAHNYEVQSVYITPAITEDDLDSELLVAAKGRGIPIYRMEAGAGISDESFEIRCLHPDRTWTADTDNAGSLVLLLTCNHHRLLFTGDVEAGGEEAAAKAYVSLLGNDAPIDVLKVAHHGSRHSTSEAWLALLQPKYAVISAGVKNRYGHPHKETMDRLAAAGCRCFETSKGGAIRCILGEDGLKMGIYRSSYGGI